MRESGGSLRVGLGLALGLVCYWGFGLVTLAQADTIIVAYIKDSGSGVDQSTIVMTVEGSQVPVAITGIPADYTVTYDPPTDFDCCQVIVITLDMVILDVATFV